jgi:histidine triad (HIT) family protein
VPDAVTLPTLTGEIAERACQYARDEVVGSCNIITSTGSSATQTVFHLHLHVVPRSTGDGLTLPWTA